MFNSSYLVINENKSTIGLDFEEIPVTGIKKTGWSVNTSAEESNQLTYEEYDYLASLYFPSGSRVFASWQLY